MTIHRFHNYPHTSIHENQNEPPTSTYYGEEKTYELIINDTGIFTLNILPTDQIVIDNFQNISFRKFLYQQFEEGAVYDWLLVCWSNHQKENGSLKENRTTTPDSIDYLVKMGDGEYMLRIEKKSGHCRYSSTEEAREFDNLSELYSAIPELPLLQSGRVNHRLRLMMEDDGIEIPRTPYELGFTLSNKD